MRWLVPLSAAAVCLTIGVAAPTPSAAQGIPGDVIVNGDFSNFNAGWTTSSFAGPCDNSNTGRGDGMCLVPGWSYAPNTDPMDPVLIPGGHAIAEQTVTTQAGVEYYLNFWLEGHPFYFGAGHFDLFWGSQHLMDLDYDYTQLRPNTHFFSILGTGTPTTLRFESTLVGSCQGGACDDWGTWITLDDVSLVAQVTTTPEPATLALAATGLLALGGVARWRRRA